MGTMICFNCCVAEQPQPVSIPELYPFDCIRVCSLVAYFNLYIPSKFQYGKKMPQEYALV